MTQGGNNPYAGVGSSAAPNASSPDKVFGSSMPDFAASGPTVQSGQIYGANNYVNPSLQGVNQGGQNVINPDQLNSVTPMTPQAVAQLRRQDLTGGVGSNSYPNSGMPNYTTQPQPAQPLYGPQPNVNYVYNNPPAYNTNPGYNSQPQPTSPNQMYMQPPVLPQISDMTGSNQGAGGNANNQVPHDGISPEDRIDYLNSISPNTEEKKAMRLPASNKLFVGVGIGVIVLVVFVAIVGALGNGGPNFSAAASKLGTSLANLQEIVDYGAKNAQYANDDLQDVTAETSLIMLSHQNTLGGLMTLGTTDDDGNTEDAKADETVTEKLDKALATGHLGQEYRDELKKRLNDVADNLATTYTAASRKGDDVKSALNSSYLDAKELLKRIDAAKIDTGGQAADNPGAETNPQNGQQ